MDRMAHKILVVDDDADSRESLGLLLQKDGYKVVLEDRADQALAAAAGLRPDVVLTDVCMPYMTGVALCRQLKADKRTASVAVILLSGRRREDTEQAEGLEAGADDYLLKPFSSSLLLAKLRAVLRRSRPSLAGSGQIKIQDLTIDLDARRAACAGKPLLFTRKEFDLLAALVEKSGRVLACPFLLETIWGYDTAVYKDPHTVEVHISSLRRKLGPKLAKRIVTVAGLGYRFDK